MNCPKCNQRIPEGTRFCPQCGAAIVAALGSISHEEPRETGAQIEVRQQVETVEGGRVVGVDLGEVLGDVNIGNYTLRIGTLNGGVVNLVAPQQRSAPQPRPAPVRLLPRPPAGFLDREDEAAAAAAALEGASPVEFHGPPGVGKTALLHLLAHHEFAPAFPAGIVFFSEIRHRPVEDLLLDFFDAFYERDPTHIPTRGQLRHALKDERALLVLDDVDFTREEIEALMDAAPACVFLSASTERRLWGQGRTIALRGLPPEEALDLMERELDRNLTEEELAILAQLYTALEGHPLRLLQFGALVRDDKVSLSDVAEGLNQHPGPVAVALMEQAMVRRSDSERQVLAALAVPMGPGVGEEHVSALAALADARPALQSLQRLRLVQAHSPRYSLTGSLDEVLRDGWDLAPYNERALRYFTTWAEEHRQAGGQILEEADSILRVLRAGSGEGVLRLGRAVEGALILGGRWGAWAGVLGRELEAARNLGDRAAEAWCLHQSGTRALCLDDAPAARADLTEALRLRESLGDLEGAALTRHNLNLLMPLGGNVSTRPGGNGTGWWGPRLWLGVIGLVLALLLLAATALGIGQPEGGLLSDVLSRLSGNSGVAGKDGGPGQLGAVPLDVNPETLDFGPVAVKTVAEPQSVTLKGKGLPDLSKIKVRGPHEDEFRADRDCSGKTSGRGRGCAVSVKFRPSAAGSRSALLLIKTSTGASETVPLKGIGILEHRPHGLAQPSLDPPGMTVSETVGGQKTTTFVLTNIGSGSLHIYGITVSDLHAFFTVADICGTDLDPGARCFIYVTFTPTMGDDSSGTLTVEHDAPGGTTTAMLQGTVTSEPTVIVKPEPTVTVTPEPTTLACDSDGIDNDLDGDTDEEREPCKTTTIVPSPSPGPG